mmetsp:Transcript_20153/g.42751  ORF Transcript_20153/g.42751 Transcript_20153/m.42751 type:complete len:382 (+) Transcript_20153:168-1313(+)|eukprot:CAMPEP_0197497426 /NCGR_PEP_ID=MMETSP1311-20131121/51155_1 /TAXON_ID=464262 /ORGANISM="Genus nov. species nov., Strain RCC856" /LENGTH=381 /DNA_ID=CAMNT_0043043089 /DNA_START=105 /DNA_END=1250 /DNA_ORIENTATION=-
MNVGLSFSTVPVGSRVRAARASSAACSGLRAERERPAVRKRGRGRSAGGSCECSSSRRSTVALFGSFEEVDDDFAGALGPPGNSNSDVGSSVGAEYGDTGFVDFRFSGDIRLDVEQLNERLEVKGAARIRHSGIAPDEAHGLIFTWDGVITDTKELQRQAWKQLAEEEGFKWPEIERPFIYEGSPERAITEMLHWTRDFAYARRMGFRLNELFSEQFEDISQPLPGIKQWLERVNQIGIPIAVVSNMSRESTSNALDRMELGQMFDALVTAEDDMDTCASQLLSASIKVARPPKKCVAFTSSPVMVTAAHNCTMKAVAVLGAYPAYELKEADLTCSNLEELSIYNVRRLFAMDGDNFMDLKKEQEASAAPMKESPAGVSDY